MAAMSARVIRRVENSVLSRLSGMVLGRGRRKTAIEVVLLFRRLVSSAKVLHKDTEHVHLGEPSTLNLNDISSFRDADR